MKYVEMILVPVLMLANHFFTLAAAVLREREYGKHFKTEHYELSPAWQERVAKRKWLSPRHLAITAAVSVAMVLLAETTEIPPPIVQGVIGCLLVLLGMITGRHLSYLIIFAYMSRKPAEISGQVSMGHGLLLILSLCAYFVAIVPLVLIAVVSPSAFVTGGCIGALFLAGAHLIWIKKHRTQAKVDDKPPATKPQ